MCDYLENANTGVWNSDNHQGPRHRQKGGQKQEKERPTNHITQYLQHQPNQDQHGPETTSVGVVVTAVPVVVVVVVGLCFTIAGLVVDDRVRFSFWDNAV